MINLSSYLKGGHSISLSNFFSPQSKSSEEGYYIYVVILKCFYWFWWLFNIRKNNFSRCAHTVRFISPFFSKIFRTKLIHCSDLGAVLMSITNLCWMSIYYYELKFYCRVLFVRLLSFSLCHMPLQTFGARFSDLQLRRELSLTCKTIWIFRRRVYFC